jgi:hypothetical protein
MEQPAQAVQAWLGCGFFPRLLLYGKNDIFDVHSRLNKPMKRVCSIFFLSLMLLNTIGYYEVLITIEKLHIDHTVRKISANENEINGNLLLKIPTSLPYTQDDKEYKRAFGEIVVDGQIYHFVKQKVYQDTLYIVCLKDLEATQVRNVISDYSKTFADNHQNTDTSHEVVAFSFAKFYLLWSSAPHNERSGWSSTIKGTLLTNLYTFSSSTSIFHPPC